MTTAKRWKRSEVPEEQTWDLTDLFTSEEAWNEELHNIQQEVHLVEQYKGKLASGADELLNCLRTLEAYQQRLVRVSAYASLRASGDGSDPGHQRDAARVAASLAGISTRLSFVQSELLEIPEEKIKQFLNEEPKLQTYEKVLNDTLEKKPYTLAPELEETLAALGEVHEAPYMI